MPYTGAGSGILRALEEDLDVTFKNEERIHEFVIIIKRAPGANDQEGVQEDVQESNQESVQETHQEMHQETHQVEHQVEHQVNPVKVSLTGVQKDILNFCSIPRTAQEILDRLGVYNQSRSRKKYIQPLVDMGVLEMTNPENPNASNQKYRKKKK